MNRLLSVAATAVLVAATLVLPAGCGVISGGDALVIAVESAPKSLDPRLGSIDSVSARLHQIVFDSLVRKDEHFDYAPHLAESFERSVDAKTWTFKLRPGIKTHDGRELTSADVKYTYESLKDPDLKSPVAGAFSRVVSVDTPDALTAVFNCSEPYYSLLSDLIAVPVMVATPGGEKGLKGLPVGTGPFKVVDRTEQSVDLEANPDYFLGAPAAKRLRVRVIPDNTTRELELKSGGADLAINSSFGTDQIAKMKSDPDLNVVTGPGTNIAHLGLNTTDEHLRDARVRHALAYALDRDQIIGTVMQGQGRIANAFLPPESWAYAKDAPVYGFDLAKAKQLLDEAGFKDPDGDGPGVRFTLELVTSNTGVAPVIAQIVQEQWKAAGVGVTLSQLERTSFTDRINQGSFDAYFNISVGGNQTPDGLAWAYYGSVWGQDRSDVDAAYAAKDWSKMQAVLDRGTVCKPPQLEAAAAAKDLSAARDLLVARGAGNRMRYCDASVDDLLLRAERAPERADQLALYAQAQKAIAEALPQIYVWYSDNIIVSRKRVGNVRVDPSGAWYFLQQVTAGS